MAEEHPPTEAELYALSEDLILAGSWTTAVVAGVRVGVEGGQPLLLLSFTGRVNKTDDEKTVNVALHATDGIRFVNQVMDNYEAVTRRG